ncbi:HD domain-containing phosphohydrolase [Pseudorhodoferax sp. Leaf267]|uniref:HD domain-containing phosphohydrolase n=1 Tax=Pseudorhodoferax sp. Leaf267 TaxID=1736316 RepID=UPI0006FA9F96|nr:HD domain-containing phosphohydrolase [Pseudorhodoferax sp. Leaf267]KQP18264.1 two-component system response regulator [Pseudorhodoferax sp. Leaf267]
MTTAAPAWTLLAVDDEPNILAALRRVFRTTGWRILTAGNAEAALALLAAEPVNAVLSDMRMPGMDGARLLEQVSLRWPRTARLLLTGQADLASTITAINHGRLHRYIAKPWNDDELVLTLRQVAERQQLEADKEALERLTQQQNDALKALNAGLEARVALRTEELAAANGRLKRNYLTSIKAFTALIELRGKAQVGHARQVASLAQRIAQAMAVDAEVARNLPIAALLHDIGHIGLSDAVLARPVGRLGPQDLQRYQLHPVLGEQALLASDDMQGVAPLIRAHHERWDGKGFPDGLRGAAIPLGARILAVADAFEDLRGGRMDGRALDATEACHAVLAGRGSQFDPAVVDAFVGLFAAGPDEPASPTMRLPTADLRAGHVLAQDFVSPEGVLLLSAGHSLTDELIGRIDAFARRHGLPLTFAVQSPREAAQ